MDQSERLKKQIAKMALRHSYWGYLFGRIRRIASDTLPSIMGVGPERDGTISLIFNPALMKETDDLVIEKILEHEGMHVLNKHVSRLLRILSNEVSKEIKFVKARIWNTAADCAVNPIIEMPREVTIAGKPWAGCFPDIYDMEDGKSTEHYYHHLLDEVRDQMKQMGGEMQFGGAGEDYDAVDDHGSWGKAISQVADVSSLSRKIDGYVEEIIKDSLKNFRKKRGELPGFVKELIDKALTPPKVPYYQVIRKLVRGSRLSKFKRSFTRINRKRTYVFAIGEQNLPQISPFPGRTRDFSFNIVVLIDTSGSMSPDDIKEGLKGIKNIIENDRHCKTTVIENDTKIQKEYECKKVRDIDFEVKGRGGTTLFPGLERARELKPDVVLAFTDGGCDNINGISRQLLPKKIIWVIQKEGVIDQVNKTGYIVRI